MIAPKLDLTVPFATAQPLREGWRYRTTSAPDADARAYASPDHDDAAWQPAIVPMLHHGSEDRNVVWYRMAFDLQDHALAGDHVVLRFGGALLETTVWLDGVEIGRHEDGFTPFGFDVTDAIRSQTRHLLAVRCRFPRDLPETNAVVACAGIYAAGDNRPYPPERRGLLPRPREWPLPAGIWGPVDLARSGPVLVEAVQAIGYVSPTAQFARSGRLRGRGVARLRVRLLNLTADPQAGVLRIEIADEQGEIVATHSERFTIGPDDREDAWLEVDVLEPQGWFTWTLGRPRRYRVQVGVHGNADVLFGSVATWFGFRRLDLQLAGGRPTEWRLNGELLAPRGTRYTPHFWIDRVTGPMVKADLQLATRAGLDLIQVDGYLAPQALIEAAEQAGFLLVQEAPVAPRQHRPEVVEHARRLVRQGDRLLGSSPAFVGWGLASGWDELAPALSAGREVPVAGPILELRPDLLAPFATSSGMPSLPPAESAVWHALGQRWPISPEDPDWAYHGYVRERWVEAGATPLETYGSLEEAIESTEADQARRATADVVRWRTQLLHGGAGFVWGTLVDSHPGIGPSLVDSERHPKPAYWALGELLRDLTALVDLAPDPSTETPGVHTQGGRLRAQIYVVNEQPTVSGRASLSWMVRPAGRRPIFGGGGEISRRVRFELPGRLDGAVRVETLDLVLPEHWHGPHLLSVRIRQGLKSLAETAVAFDVGEEEPTGGPSLVPSWALGTSYRAGSLQASGDGFVFVLRAGFRRAQINHVLGLTVDGKPISISRIQLVAEGVVRPARTIKEKQPLVVPRGKPVTVWIDGIRLAPGEHYVEWSFRTPHLRHAEVRFRDYAA